MRQVTVLLAVLVAIALAPATPARAQLATTTFVSGFGFDTNPCTVAAPCRSFQHAHDQTAAGGQITMLDPAGYGAVTISKAISIVNDGGGEAGITDAGTANAAITINAGPSDVVNLRGLTLNGVGSDRDPILFNSGGALNIQNCVIRAFIGGVVIGPSAGVSTVTISDTIVSDGGSALNGFGNINFFGSGSGTVRAFLTRVALLNYAGNGFYFAKAGTGASLQATIVDSVADGTGSGSGIFADAGSIVTVINSKVTHYATGVSVGISGRARISQVTLVGNGQGYNNSVLGTLQTFGDNYIIDTGNSGTLSPISPQ